MTESLREGPARDRPTVAVGAARSRQLDGATQLAGMRVGVALLVWAEWMGPLRPVHHLHDLGQLALAAIPWVSTPLLLLGVASRASAGITGISLLALSVTAGHAQGARAGGLALDGLEIWLLATICLALAFSPCGAAFSVDAARGRPAGAEHGGRLVLRALVSTLGLGMVLGHASPPWWDGTWLSGLVEARGGSVLPGSEPVWAGLSVVWRLGELALVGLPWVRAARPPGLAVIAAGGLLVWALLWDGTFGLLGVLLAWGCLDPAEVPAPPSVRGRSPPMTAGSRQADGPYRAAKGP